MWRGPRALCSRGGDCEAACERSGFGGLNRKALVECCSLKKTSETTDDIIQKDVTSGTVTPSRIDLLNLSRSDTANEFNIVGSTNDIDEKVQNEKSGTDQTSNETNGMHENKEPIGDSTPTIRALDAV